MHILQHIRDGRYTTFDLPVDGLRVKVGDHTYQIMEKDGELEVSTVNSKRGIIAVPVSQSVMRLVDRDVDMITIPEERAARETAGLDED